MKLYSVAAAMLASAAIVSSQSLIEDTFTYADGDLSSVGTGGNGWDPSGWQVGNSSANTRFAVINGQCMFQGGGTSASTWQPRAFTAPISTAVGLNVVMRFTLIRAERQPGRGIGIELTLGGVRKSPRHIDLALAGMLLEKNGEMVSTSAGAPGNRTKVSPLTSLIKPVA